MSPFFSWIRIKIQKWWHVVSFLSNNLSSSPIRSFIPATACQAVQFCNGWLPGVALFECLGRLRMAPALQTLSDVMAGTATETGMQADTHRTDIHQRSFYSKFSILLQRRRCSWDNEIPIGFHFGFFCFIRQGRWSEKGLVCDSRSQTGLQITVQGMHHRTQWAITTLN